MAFALIFNNFFWFPEVLLLFWIVVSQGEWGQVARLEKRDRLGRQRSFCSLSP